MKVWGGGNRGASVPGKFTCRMCLAGIETWKCASYLLLCLPALPSVAQPLPPDQPAQFDAISVTVTREARTTKEVPQSVSVVDEKRIKDVRMFNIKDALQGQVPGLRIESNNNAYDARISIRGAGLKAQFGVREINLLRDGVPILDPDSFGRLDFVDPDDIERIEVTRGPGDLYSAGTAGGTIHIISRSAFDDRHNVVRGGVGNWGTHSLHTRFGKVFDEHALAFTFSRRHTDNDWREHNRFSSTNAGLKHGWQLGGSSLLETEVTYSDVKLNLPGSLNREQYARYRDTGNALETQDPWKNSARDSQILFMNSRLEHRVGNWLFKPRIYYNQWKQFHPVTGQINVTDGWERNFGIDFEGNHTHSLFGIAGSMVIGGTWRRNWNDGALQYAYADVLTVPGSGRILSTLSDRKGQLNSRSKSTNDLWGIYFLESLSPLDRLTVDLQMRFDQVSFDIERDEFQSYDFANGRYVPGRGLIKVRESYDLFAPKAAITYRATDQINIYATVAHANQVPADSEVQNAVEFGRTLKASGHLNYEAGFKGRGRNWSFDLAGYHTDVSNEIISLMQNFQTLYVNAGKTDKNGFEFFGNYAFDSGLEVGTSYTYTSLKFSKLTEPLTMVDPVTNRRTTINADRSGNQTPRFPEHMYFVYTTYRHPSGWHGRVETRGQSNYFTDNANTERRGGYHFLTNLTVGYDRKHWGVTFNVQNLFDKRYAVDVNKDASGSRISFTPGMPRTFMGYVSYKF
ncbi:TonB-dependent receptor [Nitrosomonas sp.]|uniref:TonB-dependent receptor n=1 Tax=Nitrosomonas sp. TaxID=42353 RepID=UPI0025EF1226|nr:TonB-dependent receptor [Nitrosomonas sp.]MCC6916029.1 TonB-dependent receptor [Nitrosomonas sp.]